MSNVTTASNKKSYYSVHKDEINKRRREKRKMERIAQIRLEMQREQENRK